MGMLDDAIREHLELKRRHGADPQEVARQEDEALGPIPSRGEGDELEGEDDAPEIHEDQLALVDEPPAPYEPPAAEPEPEDEPELPPVGEEAAEEPAFDVQQQTVEFSAEEREAAEEPPVDPEDPEEPADELEETPEFLQETP